MIYTVQDGENCLEAGGIMCQTRSNNSESMCCMPDDFGSENCTSIPRDNNPNFYNFEFCSTDVYTEPLMTTFSFPFDTNYCQMGPCYGGQTTTLADNDCTFTNPYILE